MNKIRAGAIRPFATLGLGIYSMTKSSFEQKTTEPEDIRPGMSLGAGLKLSILPRHLSLEVIGRWNTVQLADTRTTLFQSSNAVPDLSGQLISWNANMLVTL